MTDSKREKYQHVNSQWPEIVPELTGHEALAAAKRLYRFAMKKPYKGKWKLVSGNRYTWVWNHTFCVNPNYTGRGAVNGWHDLVHFVSHYCHRRLWPAHKPHSATHHHLEREMVAYVIKSGWLDGKLKGKAQTKAPVDQKAVRLARINSRIDKWEAKRKRAHNALKKLERQRKYYERTMTAPQ